MCTCSALGLLHGYNLGMRLCLPKVSPKKSLATEPLDITIPPGDARLAGLRGTISDTTMFPCLQSQTSIISLVMIMGSCLRVPKGEKGTSRCTSDYRSRDQTMPQPTCLGSDSLRGVLPIAVREILRPARCNMLPKPSFNLQ